MEPHSSVVPSVSRFVRYRKLHLSVPLTQAGVIGPMRAIACSDATADMTFMTAGEIATLYPEFTVQQKRAQRAQTTDPRGRVELEHQRVTLLLWRLIRPFLEAHVVVLSLALAFSRRLWPLWGFRLERALRCQANCDVEF
jgi:hypothetical protein